MTEIQSLTFKNQEFLVVEKNAQKWLEENPAAVILNGEQLAFCLNNMLFPDQKQKFETGYTAKQDKYEIFKNLKKGETVFVDIEGSTPAVKNMVLACSSDQLNGLQFVLLDPKQEIQALFSNLKEKVLQSREKKCDVQTSSTIKI